jgi:hypothetical protein
MSGVVVFDPAAFVLAYPAFAAYNSAHGGSLQFYFDTAAQLYVNNTPGSIVTNVTTRKLLLWMVTAHLAQLAGVAGRTGAAAGASNAANQVGRISQASEGTVSASFDSGPVLQGQAYWMQTQYGAQYWSATSIYRTFRYRGPRRCC